jgi:hypothetical protein
MHLVASDILVTMKHRGVELVNIVKILPLVSVMKHAVDADT